MEFIVLSILSAILSLYILYIIIERAVRRGIDTSETGQLIQRHLQDKGEPPLTNSEIEAELENDRNKED
ncbi:hypothetical protein [Bacillus sp. AK031]